ncbi:MAG: hypothetical protein WCX70_02405 [Candidatus Paceibacterota bacterium]|jgi:hypothetical protein
MSIKDYISKVREKPEPKRQTLLMVWSSGLTLFIALIWFINFNFLAYNQNLEEAEILAQVEKAAEAGQTEIITKEEKSNWLEFIKRNTAAVVEGFKVLTGQMEK